MDFSYNIEHLSQNIKVCVSKDHTFGTDAFLLADFSNPKQKDIVCDFGTGCGIIPLYWSIDHKPKITYAIDIMPQAIKQLKHSITLSKINNQIVPMEVDLKNITEKLEKNTCTMVTMNPPYKPKGSGLISRSDAEKTARHETMATFSDIAKSASSLLKFGGKFVICQRPERLFEISDSMKKYNMEPKRLRFVKSKTEEKPWLFLLEGRKGGNPFLEVLPDLVTRKEDGSFTDEMMRIYKNYGGDYE